jgi:putative colanic acid biosynthesis UDP-glucose lipid carrier transferase
MEKSSDNVGFGYRNNLLAHAVLSKLLDMIFIFVSLFISVFYYLNMPWGAHFVLMAIIAMLVFFVIGEMSGLYRVWRGVPFRHEVLRVLTVWLVTLLVLLFLAYATKTSSEYSRGAILIWIVITPVFMITWRFMIRYLLQRLRLKGHNLRTVAIVGAGSLGVEVAYTILKTPEFGLELKGIFDDRADESDRIKWDKKLLGGFADLVEQAKSGKFDLIYIALPLTAQDRIMELVNRLADTTACVYLVPDLFISNLFHGQWSSLNGLSMISVFDTPFRGVDGWLKRAQDILLAMLILVIISIPMLMISIGIKLTSPGPVLFRQFRYGIDGKRIKVLKFRTMTVADDGKIVIQATKDDQRITPFGKFL